MIRPLHRITGFLFIGLLCLSACRDEPPPSPVATPAQALTAEPTAARPSPGPATATGSQIFIPAAQSGGDPPSLSAATSVAYPVRPAPTDTPAPPTATPEPPYPQYSGPPLDRDDIGLQIYLHRQDPRDLLRHLQALDAGWVKVQVSWKLHEPRPGEYSEELFGELDRLVSGANGQGVKVLLSVGKAPEWSRATTELDGPPADYGHFEAFMRYLGTRYQGRVQAYELWNEPNLQREWNGSPLSAADFVELMRRGAAGARSADPAALLISGAMQTSYMSMNNAFVLGRANPEYHGRIMSLFSLDRGLLPLGAFLGGLLSELIGPSEGLMVMASLCLVTTLLIAILVPSIRRIE